MSDSYKYYDNIFEKIKIANKTEVDTFFCPIDKDKNMLSSIT